MSRRIVPQKKYVIALVTCVIVVVVFASAYAYYTTATTHRIVAVGDIAKKGGKHELVADLVRKLNPEKVLILGDIAYEDGTAQEFAELYDPSWGSFKNITAASPGNHEYHTPGAKGYYEYFGTSAGPDERGYYSFDLGSWHIISLNSEVLDTAQLSWLEDDLKNAGKKCILAFWHKPRYSSGLAHGNNSKMKPFWDRLYVYGADLVLNGHEHVYERFAKQNNYEKADYRGIRQFTVGTGGTAQYGFREKIRVNSQARAFNVHGVLSLTLRNGSYDAEFVSAPGTTFTDRVAGEDCNE